MIKKIISNLKEKMESLQSELIKSIKIEIDETKETIKKTKKKI